jgi:hypothetical protein
VMWSDIAHRYLVPITGVNWDIRGFQAKDGPRCRPVIIDAAFPNNAPARDEILRLAEKQGYVDVGYMPSAFPGVPASTLETYFVPPTLFLFKDVDLSECASAGDLLVSRKFAGSPLPFAMQDANATWSKAVPLPYVPAPFEPDEYYTSWSGSAAGTGRARFTVPTGAARTIVVPYVTGLDARHQAIEIRNAATHEIIWAKSPLEHSPSWSLAVVRLPEGTDAIVLDATDDGSDTGEWLGIAAPRLMIENADPQAKKSPPA